jgi:hypothetical protein
VFLLKINDVAQPQARHLSRLDLEHIADRFTCRYFHKCGPPLGELPPVEPERFAAEIMKLQVHFLPLCTDGSILGLSAFDEVAVEIVADDGAKELIALTANDIAVDAALTADGQTGRRNFTMMHEVAHHILCRLYPREYGPICHRKAHVFYRSNSRSRDWVEWQADTLASALIMPRTLMVQCMRRFGLGNKLEMLNKIYRANDYQKFCNIAEFLGVSKQALEIRMKQLGMLGISYLKDPHALVNVYMEEPNEL